MNTLGLAVSTWFTLQEATFEIDIRIGSRDVAALGSSAQLMCLAPFAHIFRVTFRAVTLTFTVMFISAFSTSGHPLIVYGIIQR
jgi:hypothetical protein